MAQIYVRAANSAWAHVYGAENLAALEDSDGDRAGELDMFYSDPSAWGRGIGRRLLASVMEEFRACGFTEATLWTAEDNHRPRRIYEAAGWRLDGAVRERTWRGINFRELRYRIEIVD